jgi:hypothetical protein
MTTNNGIPQQMDRKYDHSVFKTPGNRIAPGAILPRTPSCRAASNLSQRAANKFQANGDFLGGMHTGALQVKLLHNVPFEPLISKSQLARRLVQLLNATSLPSHVPVTAHTQEQSSRPTTS